MNSHMEALHRIGGMREGAGSFHTFLDVPPSRDLHIFSYLEALYTLSSWVLMDASV
jgi:hypothetical protein